MPSPDVSAIADLTIFDATPSDLVDRAATSLQFALPEASLPVGSIEMTLIESLAILVSEIGYALNRVPGAVLESLLARLYGIPRSQGLAPTAAVQVVASAAGASVPVGSIVQVTVGDEIVAFSTVAELTILAGVPSALVGVIGAEATDSANGIPVGTPVEFITATTGVNGVTLSQAIGGGAAPEDAEAYLDRAGIRLQRLTETLVLPAQFQAWALEQPGVYRARAVNNYNSATSLTAAGHVSVAVLSSAGTTLAAGSKGSIEAAMDLISLANLGVHVFDPTITSVPVVATVHGVAGADLTVVRDACVGALDNYLSPLTWGWGATVRRNELIAVLESVAGVDYLTAGHPTAPAADVVLAGAAPLAVLGAAGTTITVVS